MTKITTIVKILQINPVESGVTKHSQKQYDWHTAECVLLDDEGGVVSVGRLVFPWELRESMGGVPPVGTYRATLSLVTSKTGTFAGDIVPQIIGLTPIEIPVEQPIATQAGNG